MRLRPQIGKHLAEVLTIFHASLAVLGIISIPLMVYVPELKPGFLWFALTVLVSWIIWFDCPLTVWEKKLREYYNPATTYHTTFLRHYLKKKLSIPISEKSEAAVAVAYLATIFVVSLT